MKKVTVKLVAVVLVLTVLLIAVRNHLPFSSTHCVREYGRGCHPVVIEERLHCIVQTESRPWTPPDSPAQMANMRGYWVSIGLKDDKLSKNDVKIVGPLYKIDGEVSVAAASTNMAFTKKDGVDLSRFPSLFLMAPGRLGQILPGAENEVDREWMLRCENPIQKAYWEPREEKHASPPSFFGPGVIRSDSHRYTLKKDDADKLFIYDNLNRIQIKDEWLEKIVPRAYARQLPLWESHATMTEDLKYVMVRIDHIQGNPTEDFVENGISYSSKDFYVVYTRPETTARVFKYFADEFKNGKSSSGYAYSVNGALAFLRLSPKTMSLETPEGKAIAETAIDADVDKWGFYGPAIQHESAKERFVFINVASMYSSDEKHDEAIKVVVWNYKTGVVTKSEVLLIDLFELKNDGFHPKLAIPVVEKKE